MKLAEVESKFADIIWAHEPLKSGELVKICEKELGWKRTTTYTVLKKLCDKDIFVNENGLVKAVLKRDDFYGMQGEAFIAEVYNGSLPAFIAAFTRRKELTKAELSEIQRIITQAGEEQ